MDIFDGRVEQAATVELTQNCHDATGSMNVFHMISINCWCYLAQVRHSSRQAVDISEGEVDLTFLGGRQ